MLTPRRSAEETRMDALSVRVINPIAKLHNKWEFRYIRDSGVQVASFAMGAQSTILPSNTSVPLNLFAIDTPSAGPHTYALQVRYVGDQIDGKAGRLSIGNARLGVAEF
jgi:hypothetical protein